MGPRLQLQLRAPCPDQRRRRPTSPAKPSSAMAPGAGTEVWISQVPVVVKATEVFPAPFPATAVHSPDAYTSRVLKLFQPTTGS